MDTQETRYYIAQGENVQGPFPRSRVLALIAEGKVRADMLFSAEGGDWVSGHECPDLFPSGTAPAPTSGAAPGHGTVSRPGQRPHAGTGYRAHLATRGRRPSHSCRTKGRISIMRIRRLQRQDETGLWYDDAYAFEDDHGKVEFRYNLTRDRVGSAFNTRLSDTQSRLDAIESLIQPGAGFRWLPVETIPDAEQMPL